MPEGTREPGRRQRIMQRMQENSDARAARITELEVAIRETQVRALNMAEMNLTSLQRQTLANVVEPLSAVMSEQAWGR